MKNLQFLSIWIIFAQHKQCINIIHKREKDKKTQSYYEATAGFDRNARERTHNRVVAKKRKIALAEENDEEYNYDESQQIEDTPAEEITIDETIEEAVEETLQEVETTEEVTEEVAEEVVTEETTSDNQDDSNN